MHGCSIVICTIISLDCCLSFSVITVDPVSLLHFDSWKIMGHFHFTFSSAQNCEIIYHIQLTCICISISSSPLWSGCSPMMCCLYLICFGFRSILRGFLVWYARLCCRKVPWRPSQGNVEVLGARTCLSAWPCRRGSRSDSPQAPLPQHKWSPALGRWGDGLRAAPGPPCFGQAGPGAAATRCPSPLVGALILLGRDRRAAAAIQGQWLAICCVGRRGRIGGAAGRGTGNARKKCTWAAARGGEVLGDVGRRGTKPTQERRGVMPTRGISVLYRYFWAVRISVPQLIKVDGGSIVFTIVIKQRKL
jgi:hypothetical protein